MTKTSSIKKRNKNVALLIAFAIVGLVAIPAILIGAQMIYSHHETYKDRPLANGYQYIGRDYQNPCLVNYMTVGMGCFIAETDSYYFATNHDPATLTSSIPGWQLGANGETERKIWKQPNIFTKIHYYNAYNTKDLTHIYYEAYSDTQLIIKNSQLQQTDTRYIILVSRDDYEKLVSRHKN